MPAARSGIRRWPARTAPRAGCITRAPTRWRDAELLAIQLGSGTRRCNAMDRHAAVSRYGVALGAGRVRRGRARGHPRVGPVKAVRLARPSRSPGGCAPGTAIRVVLAVPEQVFARYGPLRRIARRRCFAWPCSTPRTACSATLWSRKHALGQPGHRARSIKPAILESAASLILLHNPPERDSAPSGRTCGSPDSS